MKDIEIMASPVGWDIEMKASKYWNAPKHLQWMHAKGVYAIKRDDQYLYVGQSRNSIGRRIMVHLIRMPFFIDEESYEHYTLCMKACEHPIMEELKYIYHYKPAYNSEVLNSYGNQSPITSEHIHGTPITEWDVEPIDIKKARQRKMLLGQ